MTQISKGDRFVWNSVHIKVLRVARDGSWADIKCNTIPDIDASPGWTKRQQLPLPDTFQRVADQTGGGTRPYAAEGGDPR